MNKKPIEFSEEQKAELLKLLEKGKSDFNRAPEDEAAAGESNVYIVYPDFL